MTTQYKGWRAGKTPPGGFFSLYRKVNKVKRVPHCATKAATVLEERQRGNPHFRKITVGYGGRKRPAEQPERPGIAEEAVMSRSSAIRGVRWLEENGFLFRERSGQATGGHSCGGGRHRPNNYWPGRAVGGDIPPVRGPWDAEDYDPRAWREQLRRGRSTLEAAKEALMRRGPPERAPLRLT